MKGLSLLHTYRIAHRDIKESNILVDCYSTNTADPQMGPILLEHECTNDVHYCLFDFNLSIRLPQSASLKDYWRPSEESLIGMSAYQPPDIALGEPVYNPFAFDVGTLGTMFRVHFTRAVSTVHLFAPLFDQMTTHVISQRFTAQEALDFLEVIVSEIPADVRDTALELEPEYMSAVYPDSYWSLTPPEFRMRWSHHMIPQYSWVENLLDWFAGYRIGWRVLCFVRDTLRI
ncbi:hypothetical protein BD413DRAFT_556995 [Trametes elegans]|nr:hypothetical protein BD413DRAFT_556995 [Trametes elegans]